jgi:hypothetical protein
MESGSNESTGENCLCWSNISDFPNNLQFSLDGIVPKHENIVRCFRINNYRPFGCNPAIWNQDRLNLRLDIVLGSRNSQIKLILIHEELVCNISLNFSICIWYHRQSVNIDSVNDSRSSRLEVIGILILSICDVNVVVRGV